MIPKDRVLDKLDSFLKNNDYQGAKVSYSIELMAKQHHNTSAGWSLIADKNEEIYTKYEQEQG